MTILLALPICLNVTAPTPIASEQDSTTQLVATTYTARTQEMPENKNKGGSIATCQRIHSECQSSEDWVFGWN